LTTGMGGYVTPSSEPLYVNSTGATMYLNYTEVEVGPLQFEVGPLLSMCS